MKKHLIILISILALSLIGCGTEASNNDQSVTINKNINKFLGTWYTHHESITVFDDNTAIIDNGYSMKYCEWKEINENRIAITYENKAYYIDDKGDNCFEFVSGSMLSTPLSKEKISINTETNAENDTDSSTDNNQEVINNNETQLPVIKKGKATSNITIRDLPTRDAKKVGILNNGMTISIVSDDGEWYGFYNTENQINYVKAEFISIVNEKNDANTNTAPNKEDDVQAVKGITTDTIYVREKPDVNSKVVGMTKADEKFNITYFNDDWYGITNDEYSGYIKSEYVTITDGTLNMLLESKGTSSKEVKTTSDYSYIIDGYTPQDILNECLYYQNNYPVAGETQEHYVTTLKATPTSSDSYAYYFAPKMLIPTKNAITSIRYYRIREQMDGTIAAPENYLSVEICLYVQDYETAVNTFNCFADYIANNYLISIDNRESTSWHIVGYDQHQQYEILLQKKDTAYLLKYYSY